MQVVFRTDASLQIGNGHVMRCLTLAAALRDQGARCHFICREHRGNLVEQIGERGFQTIVLVAGDPEFQPTSERDTHSPAHLAWLGVDSDTDTAETIAALQSLRPDWLIVDHYALDRSWEQALRPHCDRLMVIDDLADRFHDCDVLLDQNLGRNSSDYAGLIPDSCAVLAGPCYALLRQEFADLRSYSLERRKPPQLRRLLVSMGGVDRTDVTGQILDALTLCALPRDCQIIVVMGPHAPWLTEVRARAARMPWLCEVKVDVDDLARLMADSDLAFGAGGSTSWERCALGLPTLLLVLAENQQAAARALERAHAIVLVDGAIELSTALPAIFSTLDGEMLDGLSVAARAICDGQGCRRVVASMAAQRCFVRPVREDDLVAVLQWRNHPAVRRFMFTRHEIGLPEHLAWFEQASKDGRRHLLIVEDAKGPLGFVQFAEREDGCADWGFYAVPDAPRGSGRVLGIAALNHAFRRLELRKVCGEAIAFNEPSITFHRRLGFLHEGTAPEQYFDGDSYHDVLRFGLFASQWRG